eukprot:CAMPEP_0178455198 /NCGR_PEP_ID=MMETSP0689_2-20121128/45777_1 /TAXON_ID=160604 /ORGANISM="Amphidinium massartii, Strain CS-259" /LENGTH=561 /DNA_ID=CAMNT_0020081209 /DNA_START=6 /DNA_END=1692 /DNA_ORIENTATION=+
MSGCSSASAAIPRGQLESVPCDRTRLRLKSSSLSEHEAKVGRTSVRWLSAVSLASGASIGQRWWRRRRQTGWQRRASRRIQRNSMPSSVREWAAPTFEAKGAPGDGMVALGAYERVEDGREWLHCQLRAGDDSDSWRPALLLRRSETEWQGQDALIKFSLSDLREAAVAAEDGQGSMRKKAPAWPADVVDSLAGWPLKGPGAVVFDPQFFAQRGPSLVLRPGAGPVIFPRGAALLGLPTAPLVESTSAVVGQSSLEDMLVKRSGSSALGEVLDSLPESVAKGHVSMPLTTASEPAEEFEVVIKRQPTGITCESMSWVSGAVVRSVWKCCEAADGGCKPGDIIKSINDVDVTSMDFDEVQHGLERGRLPSTVYLREVPAEDASMELFSGAGASAKALVPELAKHLGSRELFFGEQKPMLFAGGGGSASHLHVDKLPLIQFCHVLHGTKFFCVDSDQGSHIPGPARPWKSVEADTEVAIPCDSEPLSDDAADWLRREDVSVAAVEAGDILLFKGRVAHCGVNAAGQPCIALFHGAQPTADMARGVFGLDFQILAQRMLERGVQ